MPANLTPEYMDAEERYKSSVSPEDRLEALQDMLRLIPKHKGTEKMQADIKRRLSKQKKELQKSKASGGHRRPFHFIEREGAGRVVIAGPANSGKSTFLKKLTRAEVEVADYPFTTRVPVPGMMQYEDIQIQLVDTPPFARETLEPWLLAMIEQADIAVLVFDVLDPALLEQTEFVVGRLRDRRLDLKKSIKPRVVVLGNKVDLDGGEESFQAWKELFADSFSPQPFSARTADHLARFRTQVFRHLEVVRVYTKAPGARPEENPTPYVLKAGSTVVEAAATIHKDLATSLKFARIWGKEKYEGQMVERDYVLQDGDLLEIHD